MIGNLTAVAFALGMGVHAPCATERSGLSPGD